MNSVQEHDYDYVVIGSGFGGSVSALRLSEKGFKVLVLEKGKWFAASDFPKTNWNLPKWLWAPRIRFFGIMKISFFRHISILSGVGVGGGSLVYANTLPVPKEKFFHSGNWQGLANWEEELKPHYKEALRMLGGAKNPRLEIGDLALQELAIQQNCKDEFGPTTVSVFFGKPGKKVPDPYFNGEGPDRTGCTFCGGCMTGCRYHAKNTLDKNYLYLAQKRGTKILAESEVIDVSPIDNADGSDGYTIHYTAPTNFFKNKKKVTASGVIFSGGVLGTLKLLLALKKKSLPNLSDAVGHHVRSNNESLICVTSLDKSKVMSDGIAIGSILHADEDSHLEPVRYSKGSGFWRLLLLPYVTGKNIFIRIGKIILEWIQHPIDYLKVVFVCDWAKRTQILLFMQHLDSTLQFSTGFFGMKSTVQKGKKPSAFIPKAETLTKAYSKIINGKAQVLSLEPLFGIPSTAHILGGAVMGSSEQEGVIDKDNKVFGYSNLYVCDGSMISANPGVNPSLTITAITERAMSKIPIKIN